jgi:exopolysaccharide production protein ExoZ
MRKTALPVQENQRMPDTTPPGWLRRREQLVGVQTARGVAAVMVVLYHATRGLSLPQYLGYIPFGNILGFGHAGVDFFFVLSGFIVMHAHTEDVGRPERLYRYMWRRITRIYPIYWVVTVIEAARALFSSDFAVRLAPSHIIHSVLLLPEPLEPLVSVGWTLRSEMLFYVVFALAILNRRCCRPLGAMALSLILIGLVAAPTDPWTGLLVSSFNIQFLMGIAVAKFLAHRRPPCPTALIVGGALFFLAVGMMEVHGIVPLNGLIGRLLYGGASMAILLGLVDAERGRIIRFSPFGVLMGNASYALYLIHLTVIPLAIRVGARVGMLAALPTGATVAALAVLSIGVAIALHAWVEVPLTTLIRRRTSPRGFGPGRADPRRIDRADGSAAGIPSFQAGPSEHL